MAELVVSVYGVFSTWAVEAYKASNKGIIEKLSINDKLNVAILIEALEVGVTELENMISDFESAMDRHRSMTTTCRFQSWREGVSNIVEPVKTSILGVRIYEKPAIIIRFFKRKEKKKKVAQLLHYKESIVDLLTRGLGFFQNPDSFLVPPPPQQVIKIQNVPEIKAFPSLQKPLEDTLRLLNRNNITSIAICGTMGAGKTTVLHNLNNCEDVAKLFDLVIFLDSRTVSSDENILQGLARRVKLTDHVTAESVSIALRKYKKCLLLCDDVRRDLKPVIDELEMSPGSKTVLAARSEFTKICQPMTDIIVELSSSLTPDEAWKMFRRVVGDKVIEKPGIEKEARKVLELCSRIPVLIKTIASSFVRKDRAEYWRAELRKLKQQKEPNKMNGLEEIYTYWMSCYHQLNDDMASCFLYTALHPAATKICTHHLIESWTVQGLIDSGVEPMTRCEMLDEGQVVLKELMDLAFLDKHNDETMFVEMNSTIQEFAMHVQSEGKAANCGVVVKAGVTPEDWRQASRISMVNNNVCKLPESTACENLLTLLLQRNLNLTTIPSLFFQHMKQLILLDLYKTSITALPSSVSDLVALKALYLNDCYQLSLLPPEIKKLESLEVLDIRGTTMYYIPEHIWSLVKLKCFRTSYAGTPPDQKEVKDHNVASRLPILEELAIYVTSYKNWCDEVKHIITLVAGMKTLTNLRFCFSDSATVKEFLDAGRDVFNKLTSFQLHVGCQSKYSPKVIECLQPDNIVVRYLRYCDGENGVTDEIKFIIERSEALELIGHKDINSLSEIRTNTFKSIYGCVIESCDKMVTLSGVDVDIGDMLPHLQILYLRSLKSLKIVAKAKSLSKVWGLKLLQLKDCPELTDLFCQGVLEKLSELETLVIENCGSIKELILKPSESEVQVLPELLTLRLLNLPQLRAICADESILWPSLQVLEINECPALKKPPITKERAPKLTVCEGEQLKKWMSTSM